MCYALNKLFTSIHIKLNSFSPFIHFITKIVVYKKVFKLEANRPLVNRCMGYILPPLPITWGPPIFHTHEPVQTCSFETPFRQQTDRHDWKHYLPAQLRMRAVIISSLTFDYYFSLNIFTISYSGSDRSGSITISMNVFSLVFYEKLPTSVSCRLSYQ